MKRRASTHHDVTASSGSPHSFHPAPLPPNPPTMSTHRKEDGDDTRGLLADPQNVYSSSEAGESGPPKNANLVESSTIYENKPWRFKILALVCSCLMVIGSHFAAQMLSSLKSELIEVGRPLFVVCWCPPSLFCVSFFSLISPLQMRRNLESQIPSMVSCSRRCHW